MGAQVGGSDKSDIVYGALAQTGRSIAPWRSLRWTTKNEWLNYRAGTWTLADTGSTNGTFVNGWRLADPIVVRPGDEVLFGMSRFILVPPPEASF